MKKRFNKIRLYKLKLNKPSNSDLLFKIKNTKAKIKKINNILLKLFLRNLKMFFNFSFFLFCNTVFNDYKLIFKF